MCEKLRFLLCGDTAITIELGNDINEKINEKVMILYDYLKKSKFKGIKELIPTYRSVTVFYNPIECDLENLKYNIEHKIGNIKNNEKRIRKIIDIPILYGGQYGIDLDNVAKYNNISKEEVIKRHSSKIYLVYMLGFTPGFPYLGGMDERISTPRLKNPRKRVESGSVGIAGNQTGIYPLESSGGWNIIGQTPKKLFKANSDVPVIFNPGDCIKFNPIDEDTFKEIKNKEGA